MGLLALAHAAVLLGWIAVHALLGDSRWWSFLLNTFVLYLFVPLAVTVPLALLLRRPLLRACALFGAVLFLVTYGGLFVPPTLRAAPPADAPRLTAMTFNVHVTNQNPDGVAAAIRRAGADVVGLQEVNPAVARALRRDLAARYPYQVLGAAGAPSTLAVLSRFPLQPTRIALPGQWNDTPLVARLRSAVKERRRDAVLSAAVWPDAAEAASRRFQDWRGWLDAKLLDVVCPMAYTPEAALFRSQIAC